MNHNHPHEEDEKAKKLLLRTALKMIYYQSKKYTAYNIIHCKNER